MFVLHFSSVCNVQPASETINTHRIIYTKYKKNETCINVAKCSILRVKGASPTHRIFLRRENIIIIFSLCFRNTMILYFIFQNTENSLFFLFFSKSIKNILFVEMVPIFLGPPKNWHVAAPPSSNLRWTTCSDSLRWAPVVQKRQKNVTGALELFPVRAFRRSSQSRWTRDFNNN